MGATSFDHDAGRKLPPSSRFVASVLLVIGVAATATWALFGRGVQASEPRASGYAAAKSAILPSALVSAAGSGAGELVESLLNRGVDPNACDAAGRSALRSAIEAGETRIARRLLLAGAKLSKPRDASAAELHLAAALDDAELIAQLIAAGADVNRKADDRCAATALHIAGENGREHSAAALLGAGADVNCRDLQGFTPLARAALLGQASMLKFLAGREADLRVKDERGRSALQLAAAVGGVESVRILLTKGADPRSADDHGWTALHEAAAHGRMEVVAELLGVLGRTGLEAKTSRGATALHLAARHGDSNCVRALLQAGAEVRERDLDGRVARDLAPRESASEPWNLLGFATTQTVQSRPRSSVLLDSGGQRPAICLCSRPAKPSRASRSILELAIWEDGAVVFAPWSKDGTRNYVAGVLTPSAVQSALLDLEESGWLDATALPVDDVARDRVELMTVSRGTLKRALWDEVDRLEQASGLCSRAALADWSLERAKANDVLRNARPERTQTISSVLVRGKFRGLSFEDGARASWME